MRHAPTKWSLRSRASSLPEEILSSSRPLVREAPPAPSRRLVVAFDRAQLKPFTQKEKEMEGSGVARPGLPTT